MRRLRQLRLGRLGLRALPPQALRMQPQAPSVAAAQSSTAAVPTRNTERGHGERARNRILASFSRTRWPTLLHLCPLCQLAGVGGWSGTCLCPNGEGPIV